MKTNLKNDYVKDLVLTAVKVAFFVDGTSNYSQPAVCVEGGYEARHKDYIQLTDWAEIDFQPKGSEEITLAAIAALEAEKQREADSFYISQVRKAERIAEMRALTFQSDSLEDDLI